MAVATAYLHARFDVHPPMHKFVDMMPVEIRQEIRDLGIERVSKERNESRGDIAAACFPIREHVARDRDVEGVQGGREDVLGFAAVLPELAEANADLIEFGAHTRMVARRLEWTALVVV